MNEYKIKSTIGTNAGEILKFKGIFLSQVICKSEKGDRCEEFPLYVQIDEEIIIIYLVPAATFEEKERFVFRWTNRKGVAFCEHAVFSNCITNAYDYFFNLSIPDQKIRKLMMASFSRLLEVKVENKKTH